MNNYTDKCFPNKIYHHVGEVSSKITHLWAFLAHAALAGTKNP